MSATSGGGGSVSEGSEAGGSTQSTMSVSDSPSTSFQTNLAENVTKITLSEENITGSFGADLTGSKINLSLDDRQQKDGIVNVAFDYEEGANRGSAGGGGGGGGAGGDFRSINGAEKKDKVPEAVNLELVNMVPYSNGNGTSYGVPVNGIPMKKDSEQVDMSTPYDEYFVPVNEHKKYMRGEKLYVTKDKRRPTSWRRCLSWIVACTVISVVLILAILAGTGVILSQEPNLVKEASVGRNFAGSNSIKPSVTNKSPAPTAEMYMYVPRSIESEFVIDNLDFDPAFMNVTSMTYQQFVANMEDQLKLLLFDKETLDFGASDIGLKVVNISRDPFRVNYRIGWNYKQGVNNPPEPIKMEDIEKRLVESLTRNQGYIDKYHIDREAIKVNRVIDICQTDNGGCSHICYYNYDNQQFVCTCPTHLVLDESGKNCVAWTGPAEDGALPVPSQTFYPRMPYESTTSHVQEKIGARYEHGLHHHHNHRNHYPDNQHENDSAPSQDSEPKGDGDEQHREQDFVAEPAPKSTAEPNPYHKDESYSVYDKESVHSPHDIDHAAAPEPTAEPDGKNKYDHPYRDHSHHDHSSHGHSDHVPSMYEESATESRATKEPNPSEDHSPHFVHGFKDHETSAELTPGPPPEPIGDKNSEGRSHDHDGHSLYGFLDHEPAEEATPELAPEPTGEPSSKDKYHDHQSTYDSKDDKYAEEPTPEPTAEPNSEGKDHVHALYISKDLETEPTAEPTPEPPATGDSNVKDNDEAGHSVYGSKDHEPDAEPTPEPAPEPTTTGNFDAIDHGYSGHSVSGTKYHEPAVEPTLHPTAKHYSNSKDHDHAIHVISDSKDHETSEEPKATGDSDVKYHDRAGHSVSESKDHDSAPEPTATGDFDAKDHDYRGHSVSGSKNHESATEPTLHPTATDNSNSKDHDAEIHVISKSKNHETAAEPTLQPASDSTVIGESSEKEHDQAGHSFSGSKGHEHTGEPTPEPVAESDSSERNNETIHIFKTLRPEVEPTAEPSPEDTSSDHDAHSGVESKDQEPISEPGGDSEVQSKFDSAYNLRDSQLKLKAEINVPETTSERSLEGDTSPGSTERSGTTVHPLPAKEYMNSGQFVPPQEEIQITEHQKEDQRTIKNESGEDNKTMQHVPHLEDILIRKPSPSLESQNGTSYGQNPLGNVKLMENGKPVIEEVIIDNSESQSNVQSGLSSIMPDHSGNETDPNFRESLESAGVRDTSAGDTTASSTKAYQDLGVQREADQSETGESTEHPKIVEYSAIQFSAPHDKVKGNEAEKSDFKSAKNPIRELWNESNDQDSHRSLENLSAGHDILGFRETDEAHQPANSSQDSPPVTTGHPETQREHLTIPVIVEFPNPVKAILESKAKHQGSYTDIPAASVREESHKSMEEYGKNNSGVIAGRERPGIMVVEYSSGPNVGQILHGTRTTVLETATEPQIAMTTLFSVLTPEGVEKLTGQLTNKKDKGAKEIEAENKTAVITQGQGGENETTKSPNDISNNIKDELSENEEFNTLIEEEYKNKDGNISEGKEIINKYPNKPLKTEKKKVKDYVKGEKIDSEKKGEVTAKPSLTPEDFILQKHVNGNKNIYDLDYSLQSEHTTKYEGAVTATDPHAIDGIPGVSFKPHGINNHDISVLQTVAPDFRAETFFPTAVHELEAGKPESKNRFPENKEELKIDKEYPKFDKDYKYEKQKASKKKDLKKKIGGKDGKNVELDDGRKYFTEVSREDLDGSNEDGKEISEMTMNPSFEKITVRPETKTVSAIEVTAVPEYKMGADGAETTVQATGTVGMGTETHEHAVGVTVLPGVKSMSEEGLQQTTIANTSEQKLRTMSLGQNGHLTIDEPTVKSTYNASPGTVYEGKLSGMMDHSGSDVTQGIVNSTSDQQRTLGTVFGGIPRDTTAGSQVSPHSGENSSFLVYHTPPKVVSGGKSESGVVNATAAHPTIIIHGQSGSLQDGHTLRFSNSTFLNPANVTVISMFNGTFTHPDGHTFNFTNYTATFPNGSAVHPTIVVRGQSGTLQDGHQSRFGNATHQPFVTSFIHPAIFQNSNLYRVENGTLPGTVFDEHFNPQNGYYQKYTNSSGTFVYTNASSQPAFIIKGESGDFGNSTAYIIRNSTRSTFSGGFVGPESVIFRNSTVFAVESDAAEIQESTAQPHGLTPNETLQFTKKMTPNFISSGTAYKVNDYFGYISKCAAGQFQCVNGTSKRGSACINLSSKCDSVPDCSDGSDELGCIENGCPGNFQCSDGTCLKRNLVCNGILDCNDESDERNCEIWKCEFDEFQCPSGRCIPVVWQCDGKPDCENHTDEYNCQTSCGNDEYLCPEGWCIPLTYKCNGVKECSNGEDEQLCDCSHEEFRCHTGGCVSMKQVCDGLDDCPDRSDEWDCVKLEPESNLLKIRSASGDYHPVCGDRWSHRFSDEVCTSLGYVSSVPIANENSSSVTTESSFYVLKNDTTVDFNKKIIVNLIRDESNCSSGKLVEIICQEFSCGSRSMTDSSSIEARLVGGMSAASGQWPSVALLYNVRNLHSCTANILTPRWVLASYNCIKMGNKNLNEQDWKFYGGSTVFEMEKANAETREVLRIIPHPQLKFNQFLFTNDLALVELDQSLQFTSNLGAVCLPEQEIQPRQICVTAGWGMNAPKDKVIRQQLQYLPVPTMNLSECNSTEHYSGFITDDKICAGYNSAQKSLCYNEEGAPLMCVNDRGEWELQGVLSYHSNCGRGSHPSIFSSITPVSHWIKKTIGNSFERKAPPVTKR